MDKAKLILIFKQYLKVKHQQAAFIYERFFVSAPCSAGVLRCRPCGLATQTI